MRGSSKMSVQSRRNLSALFQDPQRQARTVLPSASPAYWEGGAYSVIFSLPLCRCIRSFLRSGRQSWRSMSFAIATLGSWRQCCSYHCAKTSMPAGRGSHYDLLRCFTYILFMVLSPSRCASAPSRLFPVYAFPSGFQGRMRLRVRFVLPSFG